MNETIKSIIGRRSIRKYRPEQISDEHLGSILEAGSHAPSAGGRQSPIMVVVQDMALVQRLGEINKETFGEIPKGVTVSKEQPTFIDDESIPSAFYGAPTVIAVFTPKGSWLKIEDGTLVIGNMMIAAHSLGVGSCFIARAQATFETAEGREILKDWGIGDEWYPVGFCILGYLDGDLPEPKPRKQYIHKHIK